ncbi:MAG: DUF1330 domain-containing protein [Halioglobus sp.]
MFRSVFFIFTVIIVTGFSSFGSTNSQAGEYNTPKTDDSLVRFAIIADLTGGERAGVFKVGAEAISAMKPDFIMSIGDLIEGGTEDVDQMNKEWLAFNENLNKGDLDFYPVVGNHDISNTAMRHWYEKTIAPRYYHFLYKNALFLVLDSEDFTDQFFSELKVKRNEAIAVYKSNPADFDNTEYAKMAQRKYGEISDAQTKYVTDTIEANRDARWIFIFMHKPVWKDENESNFKKIEKTLGGEKYTVFNGHVHGYEYTKRFGRDYIQLATTGGEMIISSAKNMDHIMWVALQDKPSYLNIKLNGMLDKTGHVPANGDALCLEDDNCKSGPTDESVYLVGSVTITDPERLPEYQKIAGPLAEKSGGYVPLALDSPNIIEGELPAAGAYFIERYDSIEGLNNFVNSPEFHEAKKFRDEIADVHFMMWIPAIPEGSLPH